MRLLKEERGISLVEVVASIVLITIILISFFSFFVQSKKTHVLSESTLDATYIAQQYMEKIYGLVSTNNADWLNTTEITLQGKNFTHDATDPDCTDLCKKFLSPDDSEHWIKFQKNPEPLNKLVNVVINVPKKNSSTPVKMESFFRWGN